MRCYRELKTGQGLTRSFQADRDPRGRGHRPLISHRRAAEDKRHTLWFDRHHEVLLLE